MLCCNRSEQLHQAALAAAAHRPVCTDASDTSAVQVANASAKGGISPAAAQKAFHQAVRAAAAAERSDAAAAREDAASAKARLVFAHAACAASDC